MRGIHGQLESFWPTLQQTLSTFIQPAGILRHIGSSDGKQGFLVSKRIRISATPRYVASRWRNGTPSVFGDGAVDITSFNSTKIGKFCPKLLDLFRGDCS